MSDPMSNRPVDPPPPPEPPRKGSSPLIWILVLIALIAFAWYFYNRQAGTATDAGVTAPPATSDAMTPDASTPADDAAKPRKAPAKTPRQVAKAERPASREAVLLTQPRPGYPPEAYRAHEEGTVVVMAQVDAMGNASDVSVVKHSGSRVLDRAALAEVRKWKFRPAMKDGKAVASSVQVPVDYRMEAQ